MSSTCYDEFVTLLWNAVSWSVFSIFFHMIYTLIIRQHCFSTVYFTLYEIKKYICKIPFFNYISICSFIFDPLAPVLCRMLHFVRNTYCLYCHVSFFQQLTFRITFGNNFPELSYKGFMHLRDSSAHVHASKHSCAFIRTARNQWAT